MYAIQLYSYDASILATNHLKYIGWDRRKIVLTLGKLHQVAKSPDLTLSIKHKVTSRQTLTHNFNLIA